MDGDTKVPIPFSDLENCQLIFTAIDYKNCAKNTFRIGGGAFTLFQRLDGHYTKEMLETYGRKCYKNLIEEKTKKQSFEDIIINK